MEIVVELIGEKPELFSAPKNIHNLEIGRENYTVDRGVVKKFNKKGELLASTNLKEAENLNIYSDPSWYGFFLLASRKRVFKLKKSDLSLIAQKKIDLSIGLHTRRSKWENT